MCCVFYHFESDMVKSLFNTVLNMKNFKASLRNKIADNYRTQLVEFSRFSKIKTNKYNTN